MSDKSSNGALKNAQEIIQRFGGIRPMAAKLDVPVTTVQGWKKRNIIPETRRDDVIEAALEHNIALDDLIEGAANENDGAEQREINPSSFTEKKQEENVILEKDKEANSVENDKIEESVLIGQSNMLEKIEIAQRQATKNAWLSVILFLIAIGVSGLLLWPTKKQVAENQSEISALKTETKKLSKDFDVIGKGKSFVTGLIPEDVKQQLTSLKEETTQAKQMVTDLTNTVQVLKQGVLAEDAGDLSDRIAILEEEVSKIAGSSSGLGTVLTRIRSLQQSVEGQEQLNMSFNDLQGLVSSLHGQPTPEMTQEEQLVEALTKASQEEDALGETLDGVSQKEMKAAALLITLTQFRKTLKRDNQPFESDLALLDKFAGDDPELAMAIEQLAPRAEQGVLSVDGLKDSFKGLAGDIVVASLSGEEISVQEKAKARLTDIIKVEKDGELISGTDTQATVARAQKLLDQGDVEGAIKELESLDGEAAEAAKPWVEEAEYTIMAQQLQDMIGIDLLSKFQNSEGSPLEVKGQPITNITNDLKSSLPTGGKLIRDEASGVSILTPGLKFPKAGGLDLNNN